MFCPTNEAIDKFLASRGVSSVAELDIEYAKAVVRSHIINEETITQQEIDKYATDKDYIKTQTLFDSYINLSYGYQKTDVDDADRTDEIFCEDSIFINNDVCWVKITMTQFYMVFHSIYWCISYVHWNCSCIHTSNIMKRFINS